MKDQDRRKNSDLEVVILHDKERVYQKNQDLLHSTKHISENTLIKEHMANLQNNHETINDLTEEQIRLLGKGNNNEGIEGEDV